jgi:hypothetical protein
MGKGAHAKLKLDEQDRRALYSEAGQMLRMCDTLTAGFIQYYAAIASAVGAARAMNLLSPLAFAMILGAASVVFLLLSLRIRRNYAQFLEAVLAIERDMVGSRMLVAPHSHNQARHKDPGLSRAPMVWLYATFYLTGLAVAIVVGVIGP